MTRGIIPCKYTCPIPRRTATTRICRGSKEKGLELTVANLGVRVLVILKCEKWYVDSTAQNEFQISELLPTVRILQNIIVAKLNGKVNGGTPDRVSKETKFPLDTDHTLAPESFREQP